jgi:hypothetical protein
MTINQVTVGRLGGTTLARAAVAIALVAVAVVVGASMVISPNLGLVAAACLVGIAMLSAFPSWWVGVTLVFALLSPVLANSGLLPATAKFLDIPLAWGAYMSALVHSRTLANPERAKWARGLLALVGAVGLSYVFNPTELQRPILYFLLIGHPFALVAALSIYPPLEGDVRRLGALLVGLGLIQVPIAVFQALTYGLSDPVQGTFFGKGAGAHLLGGYSILVAAWILAQEERVRLSTVLPPIALLALSILADAKGAMLASVPVAIALSSKLRGSIRGLPLIGAVIAMLAAYPAGTTAVSFLERAFQGQWGKATAFSMVARAMGESPASVLFGLGPASTVSRTAFMTTDLLLREDSPLRVFDLTPAAFAVAAEAAAVRASGGATSFNSAQSSAIGILGDLGLVGAIAYIALVLRIVRRLLRSGTLEGRVVAGLWGMFFLLGIVFDWWEEPPFTIPLAIVTGLALARRERQAGVGVR